MRWSLQLLPYQLWPNTTRGSKIFVSDAEYRCPVVPGRTFRYFRNVIPAIPACPVRPPRANIRPMPAFMSTRPSPTLAELLMPLPAANPFSTMRASLRWYSSEELEDGVTYGGQSWLRRGSVDSFFSALLLRDGDAAGRRKRSSS